MAGKAGLKAGLVGGGVAAILAFTAFIPCLECVSLPLMFVAFALAGGLAARWMPKPRTSGDGAAAGAVAGAVSGAIGGVVWAIVSAVSFKMMGGTDYLIQNLPPETLQAFEDAGINISSLFTQQSYGLMTALCGGAMWLAAIGLAALVGAIFGAARGDSSVPAGGQIIEG